MLARAGSVGGVTTAGIGHGLLLLTIGASLAATLASQRWAPIGRRFLWVATAAAATATALLARALIALDFSLIYVADAARRSASTPFRLAGLWAGMSGSLLLWLTVVALAGVWGNRRVAHSTPRLVGSTQTVVAALVLGLSTTVLWASDPFASLNVPATDGGGIVPILEHPAMLIHPPLLYLGLALTVPLFAMTVAGLWHRELDLEWSRLARSTALASWCILTVAMALGAAWADDELGWGGFWAWDPVENGVLLPWLMLTAFLHARQRFAVTRLGASLPIATFLLASLGALLSRSGAVLSVHAFAEADRVGRFLSVIAVITLVVSAVALLKGWPPASAPSFGFSARLLRANAVALVGLTVLVTLGTVWPVLESWTGGRKRSVGPDYFNAVVFPAAAILLLALGLDAWRGWRNRRLGAMVCLGGGGAALLVVQFLHPGLSPSLVLIGCAAGALIATVGGRTEGRLAQRLAHAGLALFVLGASASAMGSDVASTVRSGDTVMLGSLRLVVGDPTVLPTERFQRIVVPITIISGETQRTLRPELKIYEATGQALAETARTMGPFDDVQVAIRSANPDGFLIVEAHHRPLLWCVWLGVLVMATGGIFAMRKRFSAHHFDNKHPQDIPASFTSTDR
jgi:cytochrome c-type biogenesis protein CcmF